MKSLRYPVAGTLAGAFSNTLLPTADDALARAAKAPAEEIVSAITGSKCREVPQVEAIATPPRPKPIHMFANPVTGTWTIISMHLNGNACVAASGPGFKSSGRQA